MKHYPKAHLWMLAPFIIVMAGFYFSYWRSFTEAPFYQHLHGLTATAWYILLIVQPYLYQKDNLHLHRTVGLIGVFLAGGVVFSALQIVPNNIGSENLQPVLQYGLTFFDIVVVIGFSFAVIMAVLHRKDTAIHARYMISTAFWALIPALSRLIYFPLFMVYGFPPPMSFVQVIYICVLLTLIVLGMLMWLDYKKEQKIYIAYLLVAGGTLSFFLLEVIGNAQWWINLCNRALVN